MTLTEMVGKRAFVIGAGSRIGAAIYDALAGAGAEMRAGENQETYPGCSHEHMLHIDVTDPDSCTSALARAAATGLDIVVNCAGASRYGSVVEGSPADWQRVIEVNLVGAYNVIRAAGQALSRAQEVGTIVTISSLNAAMPVPGYSSYCASKAGLDMLIKVAALELAPGIRINGIAPGPVETGKGLLFRFPGFLEGVRRRHPLGERLALPSEIAKVAVFLASDASSWITGQVLVVDGGVGLDYGQLPEPLIADAQIGEVESSEVRSKQKQ